MNHNYEIGYLKGWIGNIKCYLSNQNKGNYSSLKLMRSFCATLYKISESQQIHLSIKENLTVLKLNII